jgi:hypothetical protein
MPGSYQDPYDLMNATAYEDDDGTNAIWQLSLYAICVVL